MQSSLEDLHRRASGHYLKGEFAAAISAWREVLEHRPDDPRAREGIRLCERLVGPAEATPAGAASPTGPAEPTTEPTAPEDEAPADDVLDLSRLDADPAPGAAATDPLAESAANELGRRIDTLLEEARSLLAAGQREDALSTLERVLILDEENPRALALREEIAAGAEPLGEAVQSIALDLEAPLSLATPVVEPPMEPAQPRAAAAPPPAAAAPEPQPEPPAPRPKRDWMRLARGAAVRRVGLGAAGLVVLGLAWFGLRGMMGSGDVAAPAPPEVGKRAKRKEAPKAAVPAATPAAAPSITTLVREAEAAFAQENYAAAVVAYDQVLKLAPNLAEVREALHVAAERYRVQQERQQKWDAAVGAFRDANYSEALRLFYRLDPSQYDADLERYKVNGWYNLGVASLQANDCKKASENLEEARAIQPNDEGVLAALDLAGLCRGPSAQADIRNLRYRSLDD